MVNMVGNPFKSIGVKVTVLVRQQNRFIAIMDNFDRIKEIQGDLYNAEGALDQSYAMYLDGIEASANRARAAFEEIFISGIDPDLIKDFYEVSTAISEAITHVGLFRAAFTTLLTLFALGNKKTRDFGRGLSESLGGAIIDKVKTLGTQFGTTDRIMKMFNITAKGTGAASTAAAVGVATADTAAKSYTLATLAATGATIALQAALTLGLSLALSVAIEKLVSLWGQSQKAKRELDNLTTGVRGNIAGYQENIRTLSSMADEYDKLNEKLGENRDFTRLTADEQERYNALASQIQSIAPEVVTSYDKQGRAIIDYAANIDSLIEKERELIALEKYRLVSHSDDIVDAANKNIGKEEKNIEKIDALIELYRLQMGEIDSLSSGRVIPYRDVREAQDASPTEMRVKLFELNAERAVAVNAIDKERNSVRELLGVHFMEIDALKHVSDTLKNTAKARAEQTLVDEGYDAAVTQVQKFTIAYEEMSKVLEAGDIDETSEAMENLRVLLEDLDFTTEEVDVMFYEFTRTLDGSAEAFERLSSAVGLTSSDFKELVETVEKLDGVFNKLASGKGLGLGDLTDLIDEYEVVAEYIAETGDLTLNNGELIKKMREDELALLKNTTEEKQRGLRKDIALAKESLQLAEQNLEKVKLRHSTEHPLYKNVSEEVENNRNALAGLNVEYSKAEARLKALQYAYGETFRNTELGTYGSAFKAATDTLDAYTKILKEIEEYGRLTDETNRLIMQSHPELIHLLGSEGEMREYLMELIDEQKARQEENYRQSLMATESFSKNILSQNKAMFEELAKLYNVDLDNFTTLQNFKAQLMANSAAQFSAQGQSYIDGFDGELSQAKARLNLLNSAIKAYESGGEQGLAWQGLSRQFEGQTVDEIRQAQQQMEAYVNMVEATTASISFKAPSFNNLSTKTKKDKAKPRRVEDVELITDRYLKFNKALEDVERSLQKSDALLEYATGSDRVNILGKEIDLLKEKQQILHWTANEQRKERDEIKRQIGGTIDLNDGTFGADSFASYARQMQSSINSIISQINATTNDTVRETLTGQKDALQKTYDEVKEGFERHADLQASIPDLGTEWWTIEFERFNLSLETIGTNFEKFEKRINRVNDRLSLMVSIREDNEEELLKEYALLEDISKIYEETLEEAEQRMGINKDLIDFYEKQLTSLGDLRNAQYEDFSRKLMMARAEEDKYFEIYQQNILALAESQKTIIDKHIGQLQRAKQEAIQSLQDIRKEMDGFDNTGFEISIGTILANLDKIDKIFKEGVDFNLSTEQTRQELDDWRRRITNTLSDVNELSEDIKEIMKIQAVTEDELIRKKDMLLDLVTKQVDKENDLKDLEVAIRQEMEELTLEHQKIEDALQNRIELKQEELKQLQEEFEQEDRIKRSLEKQLELMRAMDDSRYSYITGQGEEVFTYDQGRVIELQKEIAQMNREDEREQLTSALQEEIAKMQEDLKTTQEINRQELEVLKLAQNSVSSILDVLKDSIDVNLGDNMDDIYEGLENAFINGIKETMDDFINRYENFWGRILGRDSIGTTEDTRRIDYGKLGKPAQFRTGGYTGDFTGGKLGILHEKELILDENDTRNILKSVNVARNLAESVLGRGSLDGTPSLVTNENGNSMVLNNPVFNGVENMRSFVNEMSKMYRRGMPSMS